MDFRINRVYTRSGDDGETGLVGGRRVKKTSPRVVAYGDVDELNSHLGLVKELLTKKTTDLRPVIERLQQELFDLGSELATAPTDGYSGMWHASSAHVTRLERLCDQFGDGLPELTSFILPGGTPLAAQLHIARTVARRAERSVLELVESEQSSDPASAPVSDAVKQYLNRLSDLLFVFSRWVLAKEGAQPPVWVVEKDRKG